MAAPSDDQAELREVAPPPPLPQSPPPKPPLTPPQRLKEALWFSIGQIVDEESLRWNRNATPQFIGALTELVWAQIGTFPPDPLSPIPIMNESAYPK